MQPNLRFPLCCTSRIGIARAYCDERWHEDVVMTWTWLSYYSWTEIIFCKHVFEDERCETETKPVSHGFRNDEFVHQQIQDAKSVVQNTSQNHNPFCSDGFTQALMWLTKSTRNNVTMYAINVYEQFFVYKDKSIFSAPGADRNFLNKTPIQREWQPWPADWSADRLIDIWLPAWPIWQTNSLSSFTHVSFRIARFAKQTNKRVNTTRDHKLINNYVCMRALSKWSKEIWEFVFRLLPAGVNARICDVRSFGG